MTNKEMAVELLNLISADDPKKKVLVDAVLFLLDEPEKTPAPSKKPDEPKAEPKKRGRKPSIDWGKAKACRKAGWSVPKIADELQCSEQTIYAKFKEEGIN